MVHGPSVRAVPDDSSLLSGQHACPIQRVPHWKLLVFPLELPLLLVLWYMIVSSAHLSSFETGGFAMDRKLAMDEEIVFE